MQLFKNHAKRVAEERRINGYDWAMGFLTRGGSLATVEEACKGQTKDNHYAQGTQEAITAFLKLTRGETQVYDKVWVMIHNKPLEMLVLGITIQRHPSNVGVRTVYHLVTILSGATLHNSKTVDTVYQTKEEALCL